MLKDVDMSAGLKAILLLVASNIFMTFAWYGHLKFKDRPIFWVILISWGIAFFEYCLQVPANRLGHSFFSAPQLKIIQEGITFAVFILFSLLYLKERPTQYDIVAMGLVFAGVLISATQPR